MSTTVRKATLLALRSLGLTRFRSTSGLGQRYICFLGDFIGENPYYNRDSGRPEVILMAAWSAQFERPVILDVGGNLGFFATQLAQLLIHEKPAIYSFEPVPYTFQRLAYAVHRLRLDPLVQPVNCALSDTPGPVQMIYSEENTMLARIGESGPQADSMGSTIWVGALTVDAVMRAFGTASHLIKIDVEGHEGRVLRGAARELARDEPPAVCLELNPAALRRAGSSIAEIAKLLAGYRCYYINDWEGQRMAYGEPVVDPAGIDWVCNIFAVPDNHAALLRWTNAAASADRQLRSLRSRDRGAWIAPWRRRAAASAAMQEDL